jgi:hypothetical protein
MDPLSGALSRVAAAFEAVQIPFLIGGSLASSAHGVLRATMDVDILARIRDHQVARLLAELGPDWYGDPKMIRDHLRAGRAFNLIHQTSGQKFDIFPAVQPFHASELERAAKIVLEFSGQRLTLPVATAEDIILAKLQWFAAGREVSERQWADITGVLATSPKIGIAYLRRWAKQLGVERLLDKALAETRRADASERP